VIEEYIKCDRFFYQSVHDKTKMFELRLNDRNYEVGMVLIIQEWDALLKMYTGRFCIREITYLLHVNMIINTISDDYVILSLKSND
jgi:hypothetical protein